MVRIRKVLIANRGEIAVRVAATCQALGIVAAAIYTAPDRRAPHVRAADEAYALGLASAAYLDVERVLEAALEARADALHPGYGFLSENPALAEGCRAAGITFIGPTPEAMRLLGDKIRAKQLAREAGVPTVPGYEGDQRDEVLLARAREIGVPLLIKASAGGGGRGMREVHDLDAFAGALAAARREAQAAFGDATVLLERLIERPRHIEFQLFGDTHGTVIHLGERECSVQRRHQKIVEEAPSPAVSPALRAEMGAAAVRVARAAGYTNAGTAEFMLAPDGRYYFLEMNARLQVEHPVTEFVTGLDLVALQLHVAMGEALPLTQDEVTLRGHAIECRIYAEDAAAGFLPSTGRLAVYDPPRGPGIRVDDGVVAGDEVTVHYDPMLAKLIASGESRDEAIARGLYALRRFPIVGVTTNVAFLVRLLDHPAFQAGDLSTSFVADHLTPAADGPHEVPAVPAEALLLALLWEATASTPTPTNMPAYAHDPWRAASGWSLATVRTLEVREGTGDETRTHRGIVHGSGAGAWSVRLDDDSYEVTSAERDPGVGSGTSAAGGLTLHVEGGRIVHGHVARATSTGAGGRLRVALAGSVYDLHLPGPPDVDTTGDAHAVGSLESSLNAPMPGTVIRVEVREGDRVEPRQRLVVLEAMKMEHPIEAPYAGVVRAVLRRAGDMVAAGDRLIEIEEA